jgi:hypothetical protein
MASGTVAVISETSSFIGLKEIRKPQPVISNSFEELVSSRKKELR